MRDLLQSHGHCTLRYTEYHDYEPELDDFSIAHRTTWERAYVEEDFIHWLLSQHR